jgi:succinate dehydrogenase / fumarate reductase flavoprotein subunit
VTKAVGLGRVVVGFTSTLKIRSTVSVRNVIRERYGNLFEMYERITGENAYQRPMRIYPAIHYTMGGLWVDYNLMSTIPGCFVLGEANFSDHGANRLGASALMQGLSDGYFVIPYTIGNYLTTISPGGIDPDGEAARQTMESVKERVGQLVSSKGKRSSRSYHKELGQIHVGVCRYGQKRTRLEQSNWPDSGSSG